MNIPRARNRSQARQSISPLKTGDSTQFSREGALLRHFSPRALVKVRGRKSFAVLFNRGPRSNLARVSEYRNLTYYICRFSRNRFNLNDSPLRAVRVCRNFCETPSAKNFAENSEYFVDIKKGKLRSRVVNCIKKFQRVGTRVTLKNIKAVSDHTLSSTTRLRRSHCIIQL